MGKPKENFLQFLGSLKLSIPLLFIIAVVAVSGTLIPQNLTSEQYHKVFSPLVFHILDRLQIFDVFHSIWFITLLFLFALNLVLCSCRRIPAVWKTARSRTAPLPAKTSQRVFHRVFQIPAPNDGELTALLKKTLQRSFTSPREMADDESVCLFAQKGAWSRLAVFLAHFSILLILAGALVGGVWGFKAFVTIPEGRSVAEVQNERSGEFIPLGFSVRCEKFTVAYYDNSCRPKEFKSLVSITDDGKVIVDRHPITVNNPLTYRGTSFYQSDFGPASDPTLNIKVRDRATNRETTHPVSSSGQVSLADGGYFQVLRFSPCFQNLGPVALIEVHPGTGSPFILPVFHHAPAMDEAHAGGPFSFTLTGFEQPYYTGLLVNHDPGVWLVWSGFLLLTAGLVMAFSSSHRRIWVSVSRHETLTHIHLWGDTQRNPIAFERFFHNLSEAMEAALAPAAEEQT